MNMIQIPYTYWTLYVKLVGKEEGDQGEQWGMIKYVLCVCRSAKVKPINLHHQYSLVKNVGDKKNRNSTFCGIMCRDRAHGVMESKLLCEFD